jgi:hypothetical protein
MDDLKALNAENGGCWFEPASMRFFKTKLETGILAGGYFITSEKSPGDVRAFTLRSFNEQGDVKTVGEFHAHRTKAQAMRAWMQARQEAAATVQAPAEPVTA